MFEIKLSQGAKPGKGGILPGVKVTPEIAAIRGIPVGEDSISPNRHPEISSNEELLDFIERVKKITLKPVGVKAVLGAYGWLDDLMVRIRERGVMPDFFTLDSGDGGTGAAPMALMDNVGLSIRESLASENVRNQAFAGCQAGQGRNSARREGHPRDRGHQGNPGGRGFD